MYTINAPRPQADAGFTDPTEAAELKRKRTFRKYQYRGIELDKLLDLSNDQFIEVRGGVAGKLKHADGRRDMSFCAIL